MQGPKKTFTAQGVTLTLATFTIAELRLLEPRLNEILYDAEVSEYDGVDEILARAVQHETETDKAALEKINDPKARLKLFDDWVEWAECEYFLSKRRELKYARIRNTREAEYKAAGLSPEETTDLLSVMTPPPSFTSSGLASTGSPPTE